MIVVGILASLVPLGVIIRFALSPQADKPVKRAAVIALAAIGIAIIICLIAIATGPKAVEEDPVFAGLSLEEPVQMTNPAAVYALIVGIIMALFVGFIILLSLRKEKKK
jgi:hypothetical protein